MTADGSFVSSLGNEPLKAEPDWQPVQPGYPRPKGATPFRASLVPAYIACASPNRTHGPPLAFASCSPPQQRSAVLTTGTPDANGAAANMAASVKFEVQPGNPATPVDEADVAVSISVTDVRCRATNAACPGGPLSDYAGRLLAVPTGLRITDRLNTPPGPVGGPGTGGAQLELPFGCAVTADPPPARPARCRRPSTRSFRERSARANARCGSWASSTCAMPGRTAPDTSRPPARPPAGTATRRCSCGRECSSRRAPASGRLDLLQQGDHVPVVQFLSDLVFVDEADRHAAELDLAVGRRHAQKVLVVLGVHGPP